MEEFVQQKKQNLDKLQKTMAHIIEKYSHCEESDVIDLERGIVVENYGELETVEPSKFGHAIVDFTLENRDADIRNTHEPTDGNCTHHGYPSTSWCATTIVSHCYS
eukprot:m.45965 g.45965  ORF g.45965 m.45965 type:complete len:106 (-) comp15149_c0_seq1:850-1167(-)